MPPSRAAASLLRLLPALFAASCSSRPSAPSDDEADATVTIGSTGVFPADVQIEPRGRVRFVNNDTKPHTIVSDPVDLHSDCPPINRVGLLLPGESRNTGTLNLTGTGLTAVSFRYRKFAPLHAHRNLPATDGTRGSRMSTLSGSTLRTITALAVFVAGVATTPLSIGPSVPLQAAGAPSDHGKVRIAPTPGRGVLDQRSAPLFWKGRVGPEDEPSGGEPPECASVPCDRFRLKIDLPHGTFKNANRPGGVQVALRWFGNPAGHTLPPGVPGCCGEFDTLHLWIYKDGALVGASAGIIAVSQSAFLPEPENGWYDVWIASDPSYNVAPFVEYEALAEVEYRPRIDPVRRLLPDLTFHGTERISFDTPSFPIFEPDPPQGSSCFISEMVEDGAQNCLRFDQIVANRGAGAVEIAYRVPTGSTPAQDTAFPVSQRVHKSDGTFVDRPGGTVNYHAVHGHYHYSSFANALLWRSNQRGAKLGVEAVAASHKVSFCMADIRIDAWGEKGDGARTYYAPDCLFPQTSGGGIDEYRQGINAGWADVYDWYIPDQYIEVSGVPSGYYRLEFCADPFNEIEEEDESNNCVVNHIRLSGMEGPNKRVEVLGVLKK